MHHFGLSDAILFIKLGITEEKPARLLKVQVGVKPATERYEPLGSYIKANRKWLTDDINNITLRNYFCPELTKPPKFEDVNLEVVIGKYNTGIVMNKYMFIMSPLLFFATTGIAACIPDSSQCMNTTLGLLEQKTNYDSHDGYSYLTLNGNELYKAKADYMVVSNERYVLKGKKHLISKATISYVSDEPCYADKLAFYCKKNVILDLTSGNPVLSNEFSSNSGGDSRITWVSWGKANSIIVIDDELRFKYSNGHVERVTKVNDAAGDGSKDK